MAIKFPLFANINLLMFFKSTYGLRGANGGSGHPFYMYLDRVLALIVLRPANKPEITPTRDKVRG
jgi:hypothetical protein